MDIEDRTAFMHLLEDLSKRREKINKLKQTLTEIKELCKRQDLNQGSRCIHILQKISECETR